MSEFAAALKNEMTAWRQTRELTKLECGLLGALLASIALAFLFAIQLSMLTLMMQIT